MFISAYSPEMARGLVDDVRAQARAAGRDPGTLKFLAIATAIVADSDEAARAKHADYARYASYEGSLARYSALMHIDLSQLDPDVPLRYVETEGIRGMVEVFTRLDPTRQWTPRYIAEFVGVSGGGPLFVGSPGHIADELERWMEISGVDGFNIADPVPPVTLRDFVDFVVPELQRRGRVWREYDGRTLRENLLGRGPRIAGDHPAAAARPVAGASR